MELPESELLAEMQAFKERTGLSLTQIGVRAVNDSALATSLKAGRELRRMTRQRVRDFMADYRPSEAAE